jgi:hypothetical protein
LTSCIKEQCDVRIFRSFGSRSRRNCKHLALPWPSSRELVRAVRETVHVLLWSRVARSRARTDRGGPVLSRVRRAVYGNRPGDGRRRGRRPASRDRGLGLGDHDPLARAGPDQAHAPAVQSLGGRRLRQSHRHRQTFRLFT